MSISRPVTDFLKNYVSNELERDAQMKAQANTAKHAHEAQEATLKQVQSLSDVDGKRAWPKPTPKQLRTRNDDPFAGVKCAAVGRGFLSGGKCGRPARAYLVTHKMEPDDGQHLGGNGPTIEEQLRRLESNMAGSAPDEIPNDARQYFKADDGTDYLLKGWIGPSGQVEAATLAPQPTKLAVCLWHFSDADRISILHPDDRPKNWEPPVAPVVVPKVNTLDDLDVSRGITIDTCDPNFVNLTDGKVSVFVKVSAAIERFGLEWWDRIRPKA